MKKPSQFVLAAAGITVVIGGALFAVASAAARTTAQPSAATVVAPEPSAQGRASATALAKVPGTIKDSETECQDGRLVYSFMVATSNGVVKVSVDALTGVATLGDDDEESAQGSEERKHGTNGVDEDDDDDEKKTSCTADDRDDDAGAEHARATVKR